MATVKNLNDFRNLTPDQVNAMGLKELKEVIRIGADAANKRVKRLSEVEGGESLSPAYRQAMGFNSDGTGTARPFGIKGALKGADTTQQVNALRTEWSRINRFINAKTSTVKGWTEVKEASESKLAEELDLDDLDTEDANQFWQSYNRFKQLNRNMVHALGSKEFLRIYQSKYSVTRGGARGVKKALKDAYDERQRKINEDTKIDLGDVDESKFKSLPDDVDLDDVFQ